MTGRAVYATGKGRLCGKCGWPIADCRCAATLSAGREAVPSAVTATLRVEKRTSGKSVTVVDGLPDNSGFVAQLAKEWKKACGTGGHPGAGWVELQGDQRERMRELLGKKGWKVKG